MKNEIQSFKLIDNTYSPEEAREMLTKLINDKISIINEKIFCMQIQSSDDTSNFEKRKAELLEIEEGCIKQLQELNSDQYEVSIDCTAQFQIKEKSKTKEAVV